MSSGPNVPARLQSRARSVVAAVGIWALAVALGVSWQLMVDAPDASANTGFNPSLIISDANMYNPNAMTAAEIQAFLDAKVPECRSGYTCLKDYRETTRTISGTPMCSTYPGAANESAAQIIFKVQQACGVSAKVILVVLQKEQSLVSDTWPSSRQYRSAMGAGCPDTADCDSNYYGLFNQVHYGAYLLKRYTQPPGTGPGTEWSSRFDLMYPAGATSYVRFNPNPDCGGTNLYIENQATHALYVYTPYQPNEAALNAGWGIGDGCSAYGNRNFFNFYSAWFGSPIASSAAPSGFLDRVEKTNEATLRAVGWAFDLDKLTDSAIVEVLENGTVIASTLANRSRPGLATVYPMAGTERGFELTAEMRAGTNEYCFRVGDLPAGGPTLSLGCRTLSSLGASPIGRLDSAVITNASGDVRLRGWAFDAETQSPINVEVIVNGVRQMALLANVDRGAAFRTVYPNRTSLAHGFDGIIRLPPGNHQVCVRAVNVLAGASMGLTNGCATLPVAASPIGYLDTATAENTNGVVRLKGWSFDPEVATPISVEVLVNGVKQATWPANVDRGAAFRAVYPNRSSLAGFNGTVTLPTGTHEICVRGVNILGGENRQLTKGCVTRVVGTSPIGYLDSAVVEDGGKVRLKGWGFDAESQNSINVDVFVNGVKQATWLANVDRGAAFRAIFPNRPSTAGFNSTITLPPGTHQICVRGVNLFGGEDRELRNGCVTRVVGTSPIGYLDSAVFEGSNGLLRLRGWSFDAESISPINVAVFVDGVLQATWLANVDRGAAFRAIFPNRPSTAGFNSTITLPPGTHQICVRGVNLFGGEDRQLTNGCVTRTR